MNNTISDNQDQCNATIIAIIKSVIIVFLIACVLIKPIRNISLESSFITKTDLQCIEYLDKALVRATIAYGTCRAANATVSLLQTIDIGIEAIGTITLNPFEFLDPLNDLVERFSWILLAAMTSIGIQEFLIRLIPGSIINFILLPGLIMILIGIWTNRYLNLNLSVTGRQLIIFAIILRCIIPAEVAINSWIYSYHLKDKYNQSLNAIKNSVEEIKKRTPVKNNNLTTLNETQNQQNNGAWEQIKKGLVKTKDAFYIVGDMKSKFDEFIDWLKIQVPSLITNFIALTIVFILNTIFLPIFTLWLIIYVLRIFTNAKLGHNFEKAIKGKYFRQKQKTKQF